MEVNTMYKQQKQKDAIISSDQRYRYALSRIWDSHKKKILFIMFNPSTADHQNDDPTIRRVIGFAKKWGYGGVFVGNIYAFRSPKPTSIKKVKDPFGPKNKKVIRSLITKVEKVVYAWGNKQHEPNWLRQIVEQPYCIDVSKKNIPKHPLFLPSSLELRQWQRI